MSSSTWIHCNQCFVQPEKGSAVRFWFTSCGHLLCAECVKAQRHSSSDGQSSSVCCSVCRQPNARLVELNRHLRPDLMALFRSPKDLVEEFGARLKQVIAFQQMHRQRYADHLMDKAHKATKWAQSAKKDMQKLEAERDKAKAESERTQAMLASARREVQRLKQQQFSHGLSRHHRQPRPLSSTFTAHCSTPATVADFPIARRASPSVAGSHSVQPFRFHAPATVGASSSNNTSLASRRSFSYLSPATLSFNRSMTNGRSAPPLLPGRITSAPIVPPSFAIHYERDNTDTDSFFASDQ